MHPIDWAVVVAFVSWIVYDGLKRTRDSHELDGYFLANRTIPWWAAGLSVMATQLSAITMIGTTGQGYNDGLRFIQFYFALPLAMIVLCVTSRGMSCGAVISAPAVVLALVLGWDLRLTALVIAVPAVVYTMFGGVQAVTWTDVKIMVLIVFGMCAVIASAVFGLPEGVGVADGLSVAGATGRLQAFDFSFDVTSQYTFWSGTIAALFL